MVGIPPPGTITKGSVLVVSSCTQTSNCSGVYACAATWMCTGPGGKNVSMKNPCESVFVDANTAGDCAVMTAPAIGLPVCIDDTVPRSVPPPSANAVAQSDAASRHVMRMSRIYPRLRREELA